MHVDSNQFSCNTDLFYMLLSINRNFQPPSICQAMFITDNGELYSCGFNAQGQLGHSEANHSSVPKRVGPDILDNKRVIAAALSYRHTLILTDTDEVYSFGQNGSGQLGLGHRLPCSSEPHLISELKGKRVVSIACGYYHRFVSPLHLFTH